MEQIEIFLKHWPRTVLFMLVGGLIGCAAWMLLPRQYIAAVRLNLGIDFNQTGKLDDLEEARIIGIIEDSLHSDDIMEKVFSGSGQDDFRDFYDSTQIYRTNEDWSLTVSGSDPEQISQTARHWLDEAYALLYERLDHAVHARALENELEGLTRCIQNSGNASFTAICETDPEIVSEQIDNYSQAILREKELARGLSPAIMIGEKNPKQMELRPASRSAAFCTFLGAFCGLLVAFAIVWFPKTGERAK